MLFCALPLDLHGRCYVEPATRLPFNSQDFHFGVHKRF